ncbi:hypothetical protein LSH36_548g00032 [Paralvinella palmiformis]|uniref:G-protein coupled receptors family 1 profile domain-containing protein n=1 Tax=Paralvinella palmiformis TaxID=53620 RepID=A0AAD9J6H0_9ANNE|nr:hypothetical protein LSH36_548g00032 [Paralvinella palmiformis]
MNNTSLYSGENGSLIKTPDVIPISLDYVGIVFVPLLFLLGLVGNLLTLRVMSSKVYRQLPVSKLLIALSLSDILVNLLLPFNMASLRELIGTDPRALSAGGCKLYFWAYRFSRLTASWMVVMICCERFVAVWAHIKARYINTTRNAYLVIGIVYGGFAVYVGYTCSWSDRIIDGVCIINSRQPGLEKRTRLFLAIGLALYSLIPSLILIVLTSLLIFKLVRLGRKKSRRVGPPSAPGTTLGVPGSTERTTGGKSVRTSRTNMMLLSVVFAFIILITPNAIAHLISFVKKKNIFEANDPASRFLRESSQLMEQLNHSINFVLYVISSKRFRDGIRAIFMPKKNINDLSSSVTMNNVSNVQGRQS